MTRTFESRHIHPRADSQLVVARLRARAEQLTNALEAALDAAGLTRADLKQAHARARDLSPACTARARGRWRSDPPADQVSWEQLLQPSLVQLSGCCRVPLLRA